MVNVFMSAPFRDFGRVRPPLSAVWGARPFATHRRVNRARPSDFFSLSLQTAVRGQVHGFGRVGAVGAFYWVHGRSVCGRDVSVCNNQIG